MVDPTGSARYYAAVCSVTSPSPLHKGGSGKAMAVSEQVDGPLDLYPASARLGDISAVACLLQGDCSQASCFLFLDRARSEHEATFDFCRSEVLALGSYAGSQMDLDPSDPKVQFRLPE